jgi:hypothetical protein
MTAEIPLHSEKYGDMVALVDDEDAELVAGYTWNPHKRQHSKTFYAQAKIYVDDKRKTVYMHSLIAGANPGTTRV